jgi:ribosomal protein S18 acetylase RimI-like enzyme
VNDEGDRREPLGEIAQFNVRPAGSADADALLALYCEVHDAHLAKHPDEFDALTPEEEAGLLREFAASDPERLHVAENARGLVGCIRFNLLERRGRGRETTRYVYIDTLVVAPRWQNRGIGRALLDRAHEFARARGVHEVELHVYEFNEAGMHLYEKLGYRSVARRMKTRLP